MIKQFESVLTHQNERDIKPNDTKMYIHQAQIMFDYRFFNKAINICKSFKTTKSINLEMRTILGKCYLKTKKWRKGRKMFLGNLKIDSTHIESRECLRQLADRIQLLVDKDFSNVVLRHKFKKIYSALGESTKIGKIKITFIGIMNLLKNMLFGLFKSKKTKHVEYIEHNDIVQY